MKSEEEIKKRIEELIIEKDGLSNQGRNKLNRVIRELEWVLDK